MLIIARVRGVLVSSEPLSSYIPSPLYIRSRSLQLDHNTFDDELLKAPFPIPALLDANPTPDIESDVPTSELGAPVCFATSL